MSIPDIAGRDVAPLRRHLATPTEPGHAGNTSVNRQSSLGSEVSGSSEVSEQRLAAKRSSDGVQETDSTSQVADRWEAAGREALKASVADALYRRRTLSDRALDLINGDRAEEYAPPELNLPRIGQAWSAVLGLPEPIPGWQVALCMAALKIVRAGYKPGDDSLIDAVGYCELAERLRP